VLWQDAAFAMTEDDHNVAIFLVVEPADGVARFERRNLPTEALKSLQPIGL
jgi:hypothetical protein